MKITKRQLKRIIEEEKRKILREANSPAPMKSRADAEFARIIKERHHGIHDGSPQQEQAIQLALDHLQMLEDDLYNAGIDLGMGQLRGIVMDALNHPTSGY